MRNLDGVIAVILRCVDPRWVTFVTSHSSKRLTEHVFVVTLLEQSSQNKVFPFLIARKWHNGIVDMWELKEIVKLPRHR